MKSPTLWRLYERALAICENALGPEHSETNFARTNLARARLAEGRPGAALALAEPALAGHERALGVHNARTKEAARVLAAALDGLFRANEASEVRSRYDIEDSWS